MRGEETIRYTGVYGKDRDGNDYLMREVLGGGSGGRYYADGEDTIHVVPDSRNLPTEFTESRFPLLVESLGLACDSGGPGRFRGGLGAIYEIEALTGASVSLLGERGKAGPFGVGGGGTAALNRFTWQQDGAEHTPPMVSKVTDVTLRAGGRVRLETPGGWGWGDPADRAADAQARDLRLGYAGKP